MNVVVAVAADEAASYDFDDVVYSFFYYIDSIHHQFYLCVDWRVAPYFELPDTLVVNI